MINEVELEQRATAGDPGAQFALGRLLIDGPRASVDGPRGVALIEQASAAGVGDASALAAIFHAWGLMRSQSWDRALDLLQLASEQGSEKAQLQLSALALDWDGNVRSKRPWSDVRRNVDLARLLRAGEGRALSQHPRVALIEKFASPEECRWLIERVRERLVQASIIDQESGSEIYSHGRSNSSAEFTISNIDLVTAMIQARISAATGVPVSLFEAAQVLHYAPGQEFRSHVDYFDPSNEAFRDALRMGQRVCTFLIYLDDEFEGGETEFVDAGVRFKGHTGDAIFWINVDEEGRPDPLTRHAGLPPRSGEKWILSQWIRGPADKRGGRVIAFPGAREQNPAMTTQAQEREADRAAAAGNFVRARALLEEAVRSTESDPQLWMKLSALRKAGGDLPGALAAIERSLAIDPLDFTALMQRALLLEQLSDPRSTDAFGHALARLPEGAEGPPQMRPIIAHARSLWTRHCAAAEQILRDAIPDGLSPETRARAERLASNRSRRTRHFHQEPTEFHYPGVPETEFHDPSNFPQLKLLEAATDDIREEFEALLRAEAAEMVPYIQYPEHVPLAQWKELNNSREWTAVHLLQNGERVEANARHCPKTLDVLKEMDQPQIRGGSPNAMFSLLAPRTRIPPHTGVANTRLVCHLPLIVPPHCGFRVGASKCEWRVGEAFVFDDTIEHEAWNDSDELRVVLIIDLWQPSLGAEERDAITAVIEAAGVSFAGG